ncbi:uncharacterized protein LOC128221254 [Mya arenaria]|uniref:uncharacterized protein LOC128221254 n=1 Tax=Mya arenaria TaxID=6604 RepID=UPI0022E0F589|nr:uncharacterized protein LOC128221254 [Mya arenaria]
MEQYLRKSKRSIDELSDECQIHVVIGNEACDLDSAVCALVYAYYLNQKSDNIVVPVLNIAASQFRLRTETTYFFSKLEIPTESLIFNDQLDLRILHKQGRLLLTLVDLNCLPSKDEYLEDCVVSVIDHHVRERAEKEGVTVKLDFVGSCSTLVAEELLDDPDFLLDKIVAELLYGTILVDTINRSPQAGKVTPRDEAALGRLLPFIPDIKGGNLFKQLQAAKFDISGLLNMEILEKDLKMVTGATMNIAMSSVTMDMQELLSRPGFHDDVDKFCEQQGAKVVVIMTLVNDENDVPSRQIAVYSKNRIFRDQISDTLDNAPDVDLELELLTPPFPDLSVFNQTNVTASRKQVMPILKSFLHGDLTPDVSSKEFVTQTSVAMTTEGFSHLEMSDSMSNNTATKTKGVVFDLNFSTSSEESKGPSFEESSPEHTGDLTMDNFGEKSETATGHVTMIKLGETSEVTPPFSVSNVKSKAYTNVNQSRTGEVVSGKDNTSNNFLSSANSSNLLDFVLSDSELVDPFSSVDSFNANVSDSPKSFKVEKSEMEPKKDQLPQSEECDLEKSLEPKENEGNEEKKNPFFNVESTNENVSTSLSSAQNLNLINDDPNNQNYSPIDLWSDTNTNIQNEQNPLDFNTNASEFVKIDSASQFSDTAKTNFIFDSFNAENDDKSESESQEDLLGVSTLTVSGHPPTVKSVSLIVECDAHSQADNLAELDESEFFDKVSTPDQFNSGENSPFVNSGISTPFELSSEYHSRTVSESGPVPPNSVMDRGFEDLSQFDHDLPSFNSAEMVQRINKKRASVGQVLNALNLENQELSDGSSTPYTPQNSFRDDLEGLTRDRSLPSLNNSSMLEKVQKKRDSLGDLLDQDQSESTELDFEQLKTNKPGNPFGDFTDGDVLMSSAGFNDAKVINPFIVIDDEKDLEQIDSLDHVPFTPVNTFVERSGEEFMKQRNSLTDPELIDKLNELKSKSDEDLEKGTNPFETSVSDDFHDGNQNVQTGSQDLLDIFGPVDGENLTQSTNLNPFLNMGENPANSVQRSDLEDIFGLESPENDNSVLLDKMLTQANQEAAEAVANSVSKEIIGTTLETFPNMTNPKVASGVAMEILKMETSDWTKQVSGDSGIDSSDSPQQAHGASHGHIASKLCQDLSIETDYLPNMDPLHGSLNMISSSDASGFSKSIETDADKEVVESESFRKISGNEGDFQILKQLSEPLKEKTDIEDTIKEMIIKENMEQAVKSIEFSDVAESDTVENDAEISKKTDMENKINEVENEDDDNGNKLGSRDDEMEEKNDGISATLEEITEDEESGGGMNDEVSALDSEFKTNVGGFAKTEIFVQEATDSDDSFPEMVTTSIQTDPTGDGVHKSAGSESKSISENVSDSIEDIKLKSEEIAEDVELRLEDELEETQNVDVNPISVSEKGIDVIEDVALKSEKIDEDGDLKLEDKIEETPNADSDFKSVFEKVDVTENVEYKSEEIAEESENDFDLESENDLEVSDNKDEDTNKVQMLIDFNANDEMGAVVPNEYEDKNYSRANILVQQATYSLEELGDFLENTEKQLDLKLDKTDNALSCDSSPEESADNYSKSLGAEVTNAKENVIESGTDLLDFSLPASEHAQEGRMSTDGDKYDTGLTASIFGTLQEDNVPESDVKADTEECKFDQKLAGDVCMRVDPKYVQSEEQKEENTVTDGLVDLSELNIEKDSESMIEEDDAEESVEFSVNHIEYNENVQSTKNGVGSNTVDDETDIKTIGYNNDTGITENADDETNSFGNKIKDNVEEGSEETNLIDTKPIGTKNDGEIITNADVLLDVDNDMDVHREQTEDDTAVSNLVENQSQYIATEDTLMERNSISPDPSSYFGSTSESDTSELVTVRENVENLTAIIPAESGKPKQSLNLIETSNSYDNLGFNETDDNENLDDGTELRLVNSGAISTSELDMFLKSSVDDNDALNVLSTSEADNGKPKEVITDNTLDAVNNFNSGASNALDDMFGFGNSEEIIQSNQLKHDGRLETDVASNSEGIVQTSGTDNNIIIIDGLMTESAQTVQSESSVETPNEDHGSGFYEVNEESEQIDDGTQCMTSSAYETNLRENETGFYEINYENGGDFPPTVQTIDDFAGQKTVEIISEIVPADLMNASTATVGTVSSVETPDEDYTKGFYDFGNNENDGFDENDKSFDFKKVTLKTGPGMPQISIDLASSVENSSISNESEQDGFYEVEAEYMSGVTTEDDRLADDEAEYDNKENVEPDNTKGTGESRSSVNSTGFSVNSDDMDISNVGAGGIDNEIDRVTDIARKRAGMFQALDAEIQGTVLQNIEKGNAFSPIESPSEEVFDIGYEINPMIPDVKPESGYEEDDEDDDEDKRMIMPKPFVRFADDERGINEFNHEALEGIADDLVSVAFRDALGEFKSAEPVEELSVERNDKSTENVEEQINKVADTMVNEAIASATEIYLEMKQTEQIEEEITDAMNDIVPTLEDESSDSDASSTTTEGSYRINISEDISPVLSPDKDVTETTEAETTGLIDVPSPDELTSPCDETSMEESSSVQEHVDGAIEPGIKKIPRDGSYRSFSFPEYEETDRPESVNTVEIMKSETEKTPSTLLIRQETVVPDIVISTEESPDYDVEDITDYGADFSMTENIGDDNADVLEPDDAELQNELVDEIIEDLNAESLDTVNFSVTEDVADNGDILEPDNVETKDELDNEIGKDVNAKNVDIVYPSLTEKVVDSDDILQSDNVEIKDEMVNEILKDLNAEKGDIVDLSITKNEEDNDDLLESDDVENKDEIVDEDLNAENVDTTEFSLTGNIGEGNEDTLETENNDNKDRKVDEMVKEFIAENVETAPFRLTENGEEYDDKLDPDDFEIKDEIVDKDVIEDLNSETVDIVEVNQIEETDSKEKDELEDRGMAENVYDGNDIIQSGNAQIKDEIGNEIMQDLTAKNVDTTPFSMTEHIKDNDDTLEPDDVEIKDEIVDKDVNEDFNAETVDIVEVNKDEENDSKEKDELEDRGMTENVYDGNDLIQLGNVEIKDEMVNEIIQDLTEEENVDTADFSITENAEDNDGFLKLDDGEIYNEIVDEDFNTENVDTADLNLTGNIGEGNDDKLETGNVDNKDETVNEMVKELKAENVDTAPFRLPENAEDYDDKVEPDDVDIKDEIVDKSLIEDLNAETVDRVKVNQIEETESKEKDELEEMKLLDVKEDSEHVESVDEDQNKVIAEERITALSDNTELSNTNIESEIGMFEHEPEVYNPQTSDEENTSISIDNPDSSEITSETYTSEKESDLITETESELIISELSNNTETDSKQRQPNLDLSKNLETTNETSEVVTEQNKYKPLIKDNSEDGVSDTGARPKTKSQEYFTRKEIFYTSAGRMSISIDSVMDPPTDSNEAYAGGGHDIIHEEGKQPVDDDEDFIIDQHAVVEKSQEQTKEQTKEQTEKPVADSNKHVESKVKVKGMDDTQEWHEDPIPGMGAEQVVSESESESDSDSEYGRPVRPDSLLNGARRKKKIAATNLLSPDSTDAMLEGVDDLPTPDDLDTPDDLEGEGLEWEDETPLTPSEQKKFVEYMSRDDEQEKYENTQFRKVEIAGKDYRVDMKVIEPYKKVLSHGGYYGDGLNAIILFCGCYLPDRSRGDYNYVMDNLFLYVISTLELLVADDYMIVYFHGATPRRQMPSFGWLKRCYQMIDRRLRKNLKGMLMVHPTLWLKTVVLMTKPFISSKFSSKLRIVKTLHELGKIVPMEYIYVPDPVQQYDSKLQQQRSSSSSSSTTPLSPPPS